MHEYGVAQEIADMAFKNAGGRTLVKINIRIGELSGIFSESLTMYLDLILREKQSSPAGIAVAHERAEYQCSCGNRYSPPQLFAPCPSCNGFERVPTGGTECFIESIEVEDE
jgi:Zn finger protein HypA/HybF involved in hydrogenase expression